MPIVAHCTAVQYLGGVRAIADNHALQNDRVRTGLKPLKAHVKICERKRFYANSSAVIAALPTWKLTKNDYHFSEGKGVMEYFQTLGDLKDTRVLLTFVNSLYDDVFTPDIMLNDKWSVNLALEAISNILRIKSDFDSEVRHLRHPPYQTRL